MKRVKKIISPTGNNPAGTAGRERGFSFVEVMVAVAVLAFGLVLIYKAFFISLDYTEHITHRMHAVILLDNLTSQIQQKVKTEKKPPAGNIESTQQIPINNKKVNFHYQVNFTKLEHREDIYQADIALFWTEGERQIRLFRSFYVPYEQPS